MNPAVRTSRKLAAIGAWGLLLLTAALPSPSRGAEKAQIYGGLLFTFSKIGGSSFDGHSINEVSGVIAPIPRLDRAPGFGAAVGVRGEIFGVELGYVFSSIKGNVFDPTPEVAGSRPATSATHSFNVDFKFHFWPQQTLGAYAFGGLSIVLLNVKKDFFGQEATGLKPGSSTEYNYVWKAFGDVDFFGMGIDLGAGLEVALGSRLVLTGGVLFRPTFFSSVNLKPYDTAFETTVSDFSVSGMTGINFGLTLGLQYYFSK
jgi:hypothetical protein